MQFTGGFTIGTGWYLASSYTPATLTVTYLIVAGGAGGGSGGGGAGGLLTGDLASPVVSTAYTVTVGAGGAAGTNDGTPGYSGSYSQFTSIPTYAGSFNGSTQYLTSTVNSILTVAASQPFTIEFWIYSSAQTQSSPAIFSTTNNGGNSGHMAFFVGHSGLGIANQYGLYWVGMPAGTGGSGTTTNLLTSTVNYTTNTWTHIAIVRSGTSNVTLYINGTSNATTTYTGAVPFTNNTLYVGTAGDNIPGSDYTGYISNLRWVNSLAVYTGNFIPATSPLAITQSAGTNIAAITNATPTYAGSFNGSYQYLTVPSSASFGFGTGDFTVECWIYLNAVPPGSVEIFQTGNFHLNFRNVSPAQVAITNDAAVLSNLSGTIANGVWTHVAAVRQSGTITIYLNGVSNTPAAGQTFNFSSGLAQIASQNLSASANFLNGYISNLRVVKGIAVYTSAFTPAISPLTSTQSANTNGNPSAAITGTETGLLTCQSATFIDNSSYTHTITAVGAPTTTNIVQPFPVVSLLTCQDATFIDNSSYALTITPVGAPTTTSSVVPTFGIIAIGGGGGGTSGGTGGVGVSGGSGGGAGANSSTLALGGSGTAGQGNDGASTGGFTSSPYGVGGGGGAGAPGVTVTSTGAFGGGIGLQSNITGTLTYYAGGGGGGRYTGSQTAAPGGLGGGGAGSPGSPTPGVAGTVNTGGGGGGGYNNGSTGVGTPAAGGSGIVIVKIPNDYTGALSGGLTYSTSTAVAGYNIYSITAGTGNITFEEAPLIPANTVAPVVSGTATVGQLLSTTDGTWTGAATITFTYQWQRNGSNIGSATSSTYTLVDADAGNPIRCVVTGTNGVGNSSANSNATANVTAIVPGAPTIGTATATGSTTATVAFTAPASDGGSTILSYTATSTPDSITGTLTQAGSGTINVTGLTASTSYTFVVTATNAIGTGAASAASNSITTSAPPLTVDYLLVAGGGGGASRYGGGGGAGGYLTGNLVSPAVETAYTVVVGAGGTAGTNPNVYTGSTNGGNSVFSTNTAIGGGGVGSNETGLAGGSGGGGSGGNAAGAGTAGQGNAGGASTGGNFSGGGGGGANAVGGTAASAGGNGGAGLASSITGTAVTYAGGGGGGKYGGGTAGTGGAGGGGNGASVGTGAPGTVNTGGGGGGGSENYGGYNGGSGIAIIKIPDTYVGTVSAGLTSTTSTAVAGYNIYSITAGTGTITFSAAIPVAYLLAGGGGGGGYDFGGGGGAGGLLTSDSFSAATGTAYTVTVGAGGSAGVASTNGGAGSSTQFTTIPTYAGLFNGSNQFLTVESSVAFGFGTGIFTVEAWIYPTSSTGAVFETYGGVQIGYQSSTSFGIAQRTVAWLVFTTTIVPTLNAWNHIAVVRAGTGANQTIVFINGVNVASGTVSTDFGSSAGSAYVAEDLNGSQFFPGYISNLRVVKGLAVYTGNFVPSTSPLATTQSAGTNIAALPNAAPTYAGSFIGSALQSLTVASNSALELSGDFTIEGWIYPTSSAQFTLIYLGSSFSLQFFVASGSLYFYDGSTGQYQGTGTVPTNAWTHIAASRAGTALKGYINGVESISVTNSTSFQQGTNYLTTNGGNPSSTGYFSNIRVVKGIAVYTSAFTPPTGPLTATQGANTNGNPSAAITGTETSLLALQNATFVDNSSYALTITPINNPTTTNLVQPFPVVSLLTCQSATFIDNGPYGFAITPSNSPTISSSVVPTFGILAVGGGGGRSFTGSATSSSNGGSGGGAYGNATNSNNGVGVLGQGNAGGATSGYGGGGGGGASAAGVNPTPGNVGGDGGNGSASSISGASTTYSGGGGGGGYTPYGVVAGTGGTGGGGAGAAAQTATGTAGTVNTGGGGGGGAGSAGNGAAGGSGIAIFKVADTYVAIVSGGLTSTTSTAVAGYNIYSITAGTGTITFSEAVPVDYLVVAGGGAGGFGGPGGGGGAGAGGYVAGSNLVLAVGGVYTVTVGAGGAAGNPPNPGSNSVFSSITAIGGGNGGTPTSTVPIAGGSGGGGGAYNLANTQNGAAAGTGGSAGGNGFGSDVSADAQKGGGGGGASAAGAAATSTVSGAGGSGTASSITGTAVTYAGGGSGGSRTAVGTIGTTNGGGGAGGNATSGTNGTVNTGGGGGGGGESSNGGNGGAGVVIVKMPNTNTGTLSGGLTYTLSTAVAGYNIYIVTAGTGTLTLG